MKVQVLVATMNQRDHSLIKKMNICTDAIVGNQCDTNLIEEFYYDRHIITYLNFKERGVGLNRNNALMRATGDICLFADDDLVYVDGYDKIICKAFQENPFADLIVFNFIDKTNYRGIRPRYIIQEKENVSWHNYLRYGTARIAIKLSRIREEGIFFNLCFGGGTEHYHGEDTLFLTECLRKGLKIIALPIAIAELTDVRESTWNRGYNDKYLRDQGVLSLQDCIRHCKEYNRGWIEAYRLMLGHKR